MKTKRFNHKIQKTIILSIVCCICGCFAQAQEEPLLNIQADSKFCRADLAPDGSLIVLSSKGNINLYDTSTGEIVRSLPIDNDPLMDIVGIRFSEDSRLVAACDNRAVVTVWDVKDGSIVNTFKLEAPNIDVNSEYASISFSPNGNSLLVGIVLHDNKENSIFILDIKTDTIANKLSDNFLLNSAVFLQDNRRIYVNSRQNGYIYDAFSGELLSFFERGVIITPDEKTVISMRWLDAETGLTEFEVWNVDDKERTRVFDVNYDNIFLGGTFSPNGKYLLLVINFEMALVQFDSWTIVRTFPPGGSHQHSFSKDGKYLMIFLGDNVKLWDISDIEASTKDASLYE